MIEQLKFNTFHINIIFQMKYINEIKIAIMEIICDDDPITQLTLVSS